MIDFNQSPTNVIIELIKRDNPDKPLEAEWVVIDTPVAIEPTPDIPRNTKIFVRSVPDTPYVGNKWFYYNRLDIQEMRFGDLVTDSDLTFDPVSASTTRQLVGLLSNAFCLTFEPDMVVNTQLPLIVPGHVVEVDIHITPEHLVFTGSVTVRLVRPTSPVPPPPYTGSIFTLQPI